VTAHDPAAFVDATLTGKRVLAVPPLGHKDLGRYLVGMLSAGKERFGWSVSVLAPTVDSKPFEALTAPEGEVIQPPHFLRAGAWESDPQAVEEVDRKIREAEARTGFPVGRVILAAGHSIGRAYSVPFQHFNRYPMIQRVLKDNEEPLRIARRFFRFADELLERTKPDFVFFFHWLIPLNMLVWLAAQRRGIPCIALRPSKLRSDHAFWTSDPFLLNVDAFERARLKRQTNAPVSEASLERIRKFRDQPTMIKYIASKWSNRMSLGFIRWHKQYARIVVSQIPDRFRGQDMSAREGEVARLLRYYRTLFLTYRHQHEFTTLDEAALAATKYIYFPMHKEAEFAQTFQATTWHDQRNTIRILASMLPFGYRLLVREHRMNFGRRRTRSYRELALLPNVTLIDPFDSQFKYLRHADLVVTENGSSGWEGLLLARRTLILAENTFYQGSGQGAVVTDPDRLNQAILDILSKPAIENMESHDHALAAMIDAEFETTFLMNPTGIAACLDMLEARFGALAARSGGQVPPAAADVAAPAAAAPAYAQARSA
jgi:hypothetical protein